MADRDRIPAIDDIDSDLSRATRYLQDNGCIAIFPTRSDKHRRMRYTELYLQGIFNSLVSLYTPLFLSQWQHLKKFMDQFTPPAGVAPSTYLTRNYISAWIHDLYVSNRDSVKKLSPPAFSQHYQHEEVYYSSEYDEFLVRLNASIRPTYLSRALDDAVFIPILDDNPAWNTDNPFHINGFHIDYDLVMGLIGVLKDCKANMSALVTDATFGRPSWLFDWHSDDRCCAWFPLEGNYDLEDVSIAYIVGVACTPRLAPRDSDDWQEFPNGTAPPYINVADYERVVDRRFFGSYEVRTIEQRQQPQFTLATITQQAGAPQRGRGKVQLTDWFQIIDWTYYQLVVLAVDPHRRSASVREINAVIGRHRFLGCLRSESEMYYKKRPELISMIEYFSQHLCKDKI